MYPQSSRGGTGVQRGLGASHEAACATAPRTWLPPQPLHLQGPRMSEGSAASTPIVVLQKKRQGSGGTDNGSTTRGVGGGGTEGVGPSDIRSPPPAPSPSASLSASSGSINTHAVPRGFPNGQLQGSSSAIGFHSGNGSGHRAQNGNFSPSLPSFPHPSEQQQQQTFPPQVPPQPTQVNAHPQHRAASSGVVGTSWGGDAPQPSFQFAQQQRSHQPMDGGSSTQHPPHGTALVRSADGARAPSAAAGFVDGTRAPHGWAAPTLAPPSAHQHQHPHHHHPHHHQHTSFGHHQGHHGGGGTASPYPIFTPHTLSHPAGSPQHTPSIGWMPANDFAPPYDDGEDADEAASTAPLPFYPHDPTGGLCPCPSCLQGGHIASVFGNQRQASRHVMLARPSPYHMATGGLPPAPPPLTRSSLRRCPVFDAFGFCPYSTACFLRHVREPERKFVEPACLPRVARAASAEEELRRLFAKAAEHQERELWRCDVCGFDGIDEFCVGTVGTTYYYRYCPHCTHHCYFPHITYLVEHIVDSVGDDYQQFKTLVDNYRAKLPDEFKVPFSAEAHRVASIVFAWSLVAPVQVRDAIEAAHKALPEMEAIVSMGSAAGYIEHLFNRVMHPGVPATQAGGGSQRRVGKSRFPTTSFDGVRTSFFGTKRIPIFAFDEIAMRLTYSVHVSLGGPLSMLSMRCQQTVLLLCWPPFGAPDEEQSSMGFETLEYFTQRGGRVLIYIGDVSTTGDWRFHQLLYTHYRLVKDYPVRREVRRWSPAEMGFVFSGNDTIGVYARRESPISLPANWACTM